MKTREPAPSALAPVPAPAQPPKRRISSRSPEQAANRMSPEVALDGPEPGGEPGAIEYASWLGVLRQTAH